VGVKLAGKEEFLFMEDKMTQTPGERILLWFLVAFSIFILIQAFMLPNLQNLSSPGAFPIFVISIMILSVLRVLWKNRTHHSAFKIGEEFGKAIPLVFPKTVAAYTAILILYIFLLYPLHFWVSSYLFLVGSFLFLKGAKIFRSFFIGAGMLAAIYLLFQYLFRVILW
jgi:hypothetical protein